MEVLTWQPKKPSSRLRKKTSEDDLDPAREVDDDDNDDEVRRGREDAREKDGDEEGEWEKSEFDVRSFWFLIMCCCAEASEK